MMTEITENDTTTVNAKSPGDWVVETDVVVAITGPGIDAESDVTGRTFLFKGTLGTDTGPVITLGVESAADIQTTITVDYRGILTSGGAGLVALSGGVTFEVTGDNVNGSGTVTTSGVALDFHQGGNTIRNDGTIRSTGDSAIRSAGADDTIISTGAIEGDLNGIVTSGDGFEITNNNATLTATRGYGILSTGANLTVINNGTISAARAAISASGDGASISNTATITSSKGAGIAVSGADAVINTTTLISAKTFGIVSTGRDAEITQGGTLLSSGVGIEATGAGSTVNMDAKLKADIGLVLGGNGSIATNANEMRATSKTEAAVSLSGNSDFTNTGVIFTKSGHAIEAGSGRNSIVNTGTLHGDVALGGGNDWFSALSGVVDGKVYGGKGNDIYEVGIELDIVEKAGGGKDTVKAMFSWTLGANIENLMLIGTAAAEARGNALANRLTGNSGDNSFWGFGGRDTFVMQTGGGTDKIMDFADGKDLIDFSDVDGVHRFADIKAHMAQSGQNVVINLRDEPGDMFLVIRKADIHDLNGHDFLFLKAAHLADL